MNKKSINAELVAQFHRKNLCAFFAALMVSVLTGTTGLIVSWIIKELIDLLSGQSRFTLKHIFIITLFPIVFVSVLAFINYHSEPRFVRRAMRQYKDRAFSLLSSENISGMNQLLTISLPLQMMQQQ